jgi:hypothetical protein
MTAAIIDIRNVVIRVCPGEGGWLAVAPRGHAWLFASKADAQREARWLSRNFDLLIREVRQ